MNATGLLTCLKHFPGQGDAVVDTHVGTAKLGVSKELLQKRELFPFRSLHKNGTDDHGFPLCLSGIRFPWKQPSAIIIMTSLLRESLGYAGVIVSDDMMIGCAPADFSSMEKSRSTNPLRLVRI